MGSRPNAHLFFGFEVDQCGEFREAWEREDHDATLAKRLEWPHELWAPEEFDPTYPDDVPPDPEQHRRWSDANRAKNELEKAYSVKLHDLGEEVGGCWLYVDVEGSGYGTDWDDLKVIPVASMGRIHETILSRWRELLWKHCELMGIPYKEPGWFLAAYYF